MHIYMCVYKCSCVCVAINPVREMRKMLVEDARSQFASSKGARCLWLVAVAPPPPPPLKPRPPCWQLLAGTLGLCTVPVAKNCQRSDALNTQRDKLHFLFPYLHLQLGLCLHLRLCLRLCRSFCLWYATIYATSLSLGHAPRNETSTWAAAAAAAASAVASFYFFKFYARFIKS